jgi:hypothetical protein
MIAELWNDEIAEFNPAIPHCDNSAISVRVADYTQRSEHSFFGCSRLTYLLPRI